MEIKEEVIECIKSFAESNNLKFEASKKFQEQGINSVLFIGLVVQLEEKFDMEFDPFDLDVAKYEEIDDIVKYVESKIENKDV